MKTIFLTMIGLIMSGCAMRQQEAKSFGPSYVESLQAFKGSPVSVIIERIGIPERSVKLDDGRQILEYHKTRQIFLAVYGMAVPHQQSCITTFTSDSQGVIETITAEGNWCPQ